MTRTDIINRVCASMTPPVSYLEVGIFDPGRNFDLINADRKLGIEPRFARDPDILQMTSDEFFGGILAKRKGRKKQFAVVFVDGDHRYPQCLRDVQHALKCLTDGGVLIMHDCLPRSAEAVLPEKPNNGRAWNGQVWMAWRWVRAQSDLTSYCVSTDHGVGIVSVGDGGCKGEGEVDESNTWQNSLTWAGAISVAEFLARAMG